MEFRDIKDVLTFAAFRPEPDNPRFTWQQRFPKMKSVLVNIGRGGCTWCFLDRKGEVENTGAADGEFIEVAAHMADEWKARSEEGWIGISVNHRFIITLEHNLSRKKGWDEELRQSPKSVLGTKHDRAKRYAIHHNAETSASLLLACDDSMIKAIEETMRNHSLRAGRICSGLFAMTGHLLNRIAADSSFKSQDLIVVTWLDGSLCVLRQRGGQWQDLRCRSGLAPGDAATVRQMITPFLETAEPNTRVILMEDDKEGGFSRQHLGIFANLHVTDVTEEHCLWQTLGRN